jgi:hypothetical protein
MFEINNMTPLFIEFPFEYVFLCNNKNQMNTKPKNFYCQNSSSYNIVLIVLTKILENLCQKTVKE